MALHFSRQEHSDIRQQAYDLMEKKGLNALLIFRQESMYYLTGYDTFGFCFFQCLVLGGDGTITLLTRAPDLRQAQHTSVIEDIRIWKDSPNVNPAGELRKVLLEAGYERKCLGIEWDSYGLTAREGMRVSRTMDGFCHLIDASELISQLRVFKSMTEVAYTRQAADLADRGYDRARELTREGAFDGDILAAMQGEVFRGGGDYSGNEFIVGSGRDALLCRYFTGRRTLGPHDQLTLEWAGAYRHYHAAMMRTMVTGKAPDKQKRMFDICCEALSSMQETIRPGNTFGEAFDAHARVIDLAGMEKHRLNACGYSLGATFSPVWMDKPMIYSGSLMKFQPGMVIFCHMIIFDSDSELAMTLGETVLITELGFERLSRSPWELVEN